jgi:hypothetical protein
MPRTFGEVSPTISQNEKKSEMLKKYKEVVKSFDESTSVDVAKEFERFSEVASEDARKEIHRLACKIYRKAKVFKSVEKQVVFRSAASHAMENCASGKMSRLSDALACHSRCAEMLWDLRVSEENSSSDSNKVMNRSCEAVRRIVNRMGGLRGILNSISVKEDLMSLLRSVIAANGVSVRILSESDKKEEQQKALSVFCEIKEILRIVPDVTADIARLAFDVA